MMKQPKSNPTITWGGRHDDNNQRPIIFGLIFRENEAQSSHKNTTKTKFKENYAYLEGYILDYSNYKQSNKYVLKIKNISEHCGA